MAEPIVVTRHVAAPPSEVFRYLTESEAWARWQGVGADIDARPGGFFGLSMPGGQRARGQFVELEPDERVVFTWGWVDHPGVPPGSTTVEIELVADDGGTTVTLTHRDLPADEIDLHTAGWEYYLPRLALVAEGGDPGSDSGPG